MCVGGAALSLKSKGTSSGSGNVELSAVGQYMRTLGPQHSKQSIVFLSSFFCPMLLKCVAPGGAPLRDL